MTRSGLSGGAPLTLDAVSFAYDGVIVLSEISLEVGRGAIVALIGPNGAGKTTLLRIAAGLAAPRTGRVRVAPRRGAVAYLAQAEPLPGSFTVREVVELGRFPYTGLVGRVSARDRGAVDTALERTNTRALADRTVAELSGGEQQRVALARALAQEPEVLLLDEPTNHLDPKHQVELFQALREAAEAGVAVLAVVHDLAFAGAADRCLLMARGVRVAEGAPDDVLTAERLSATYGAPIDVLVAPDGRRVAVPRVGGRSRVR